MLFADDVAKIDPGAMAMLATAVIASVVAGIVSILRLVFDFFRDRTAAKRLDDAAVLLADRQDKAALVLAEKVEEVRRENAKEIKAAADKVEALRQSTIAERKHVAEKVEEVRQIAAESVKAATESVAVVAERLNGHLTALVEGKVANAIDAAPKP